MALIRLQTEAERQKGIYYQFDPNTSPIGEGGMGIVREGLCINEHNGSTRPVAIKFMFDDLPPSAYERARREAEIQLRNDSLVEMLGFIETQELSSIGEVRKHYHVISELLTGVSLSDILGGKTKDHTGEDVPFAVKMLQDFRNDPEHFAQIVVINVLSGLMALHDAGYIHRDIDPTNIMFTNDGHIKLIDFGIAKQMNTLTTGDKSLTVTGKFMGKPEYAAPELVLGDISHQNQTTDIYSVGILLYQCIIGHTPFEGARHEILEKQLKAKLPLGKIKSRALRNIIATACEKKQEYRYQTAAQMRVAIENLSREKQLISPSKTKLLIGCAAILVIFLASILSSIKYKQTKAQEEANRIAITARMEQSQEEAKRVIEKDLNEANKLYQQGKLQEYENYEHYLTAAYTAYATCLEKVQKDSLLTTYEKSITAKLDSVIADIQAAKDSLHSQAIQFKAIKGAMYLSEQYQAKSDSLNVFLNNINAKK